MLKIIVALVLLSLAVSSIYVFPSALPQPTDAISPGQQVALAGDEGLVQGKPKLFNKQLYYLPGCDKCRIRVRNENPDAL